MTLVQVKSNESHDSEEILERNGKLAPAGSRTQDNLCPNMGFQQPKPTNQAGTIRPLRNISPNLVLAHGTPGLLEVHTSVLNCEVSSLHRPLHM